MTCALCDMVLPTPARTGRPRVYCQDGACQRAYYAWRKMLSRANRKRIEAIKTRVRSLDAR